MEVGVEVDDGGHVALLERHKRSQAFPGSGPWRLDGVMRPIMLLSVSGRGSKTNSQPASHRVRTPESHRSWRWTEYRESLVWLLSLKPACKWCAFLRRRAWTDSK